jgi:4-coumarate--CoA ligase
MLAPDYDRVVADLVATELARLRRTSSLVGALAGLGPQTELGEGGLAADSLELLHLAGAVNEMFHLHETSVEDYLLQHRTLGAWAEVIRRSRAVAGERITFRTSGSTDVPKACTHAWAELAEEVRVHSAAWGGIGRVVSFVPAHHVYGFLFTVLLPVELGASVVDARRWPASRLERELGSADLLVATPTYWDYLSRSLRRFRGLRGVTSTAPCPPALFSELTGRGLALTEIYGSSETAGIASRTSAGAPFELLPYWECASERSLRRMAPTRAEACVTLPDHVRWCDARRFHLGTRVDGAVQVGGVNVFPAHVAEKIGRHPAVAACAVRPMRADEGSRLKAFVVWHEQADAAERANFHTWLRDQLAVAERPAVVTTGTALPRNALGKLTDWDASAN